MEDKYLIISYCTCVFAVVAFATYAVVTYWRYSRTLQGETTSEQFITARGTQNTLRIGWSFFASAVGAWCITAPPSFAAFTGIIGLLSYSISAGLPILLLALFGSVIQRRHPDCLSLSDYVGKRYGPVFRTMVVGICVFNLSIALLAEYTTIGSLFQDYVGSVNYPVVIVTGILTMTYTCYGGLFISIVTDQVQAILTTLFITILVVYTAITFRRPLDPADIKPDAVSASGWVLGPNKSGYGTIYSMPCSLIAATCFSEAMWQKVWASRDRKTLIIGGTMGFLLTTTAVFIFGFGGWLAAWGGLIGPYTNPNLYLFQVFSHEAADPNGQTVESSSARVSSWIGVVTLILAVTMNESAIDSMQNGLTASVSAQWFKGQHSIFARIIVICINVPIMIVSFQGYTILSLFVITNMLCSCCFIPVGVGLFECTKGIITETAAIFGCCVAILTTCAYGAGRWWDSADPSGSIAYGVNYAWFGNLNYEYDYFLVASGFSVVGMAMWVGGAWVVRKLTGWEGPGITGVLCRLPAFRQITGEPYVDIFTLPALRGLGRKLGHEASFGEGVLRPQLDVHKYDTEVADRSSSDGTYNTKPADMTYTVHPAKGGTMTGAIVSDPAMYK